MNTYPSFLNSISDELIGTYKNYEIYLHHFDVKWNVKQDWIGGGLGVNSGWVFTNKRSSSLFDIDLEKTNENYQGILAEVWTSFEVMKIGIDAGIRIEKNIRSAVEEERMIDAEKASTGTSVIEEYLRSGEQTIQRLFVEGSLWNVVLLVENSNIDNETHGKLVGNTASQNEIKFKISFGYIDILSSFKQCKTNYKDDRGLADQFWTESTYYDSKFSFKVTKRIRVIVVADAKSQDSSLDEYKYSDSSYAIVVGWVDIKF